MNATGSPSAATEGSTVFTTAVSLAANPVERRGIWLSSPAPIGPFIATTRDMRMRRVPGRAGHPGDSDATGGAARPAGDIPIPDRYAASSAAPAYCVLREYRR